MARPVQSSDRCKWRRYVASEEDLSSLIVEAAATIRQQPGIFERTHQSTLRRCRLCIEVSGLRLNIYLNWYEIQFIFKILQWFCLISNLSHTQFDGP